MKKLVLVGLLALVSSAAFASFTPTLGLMPDTDSPFEYIVQNDDEHGNGGG